MANDNFKPTVDLRQNAQPPRPSATPPLKGGDKFQATPKPAEFKELPRELEVEDKKAFQKISRPAAKIISERSYRGLIILIALMVAVVSFYWFVYRPRAAAPKETPAKWYMVKLSDSETFYGQIKNTGGDPVVIDNVYYDYDQVNKKEAAGSAGSPQAGAEQTGSIRLVKRGKETHGPSGSLDIVRSQVLYMESLADDSKVLKAIIEYEKGK
jgi:hypothetical protein